jgi:hypothetical protein
MKINKKVWLNCHIFCMRILKLVNRIVCRVFWLCYGAARLENRSWINHSPPLELKVFASRKPGVILLTQVGQGSRWSVVPIMGSYLTEGIKSSQSPFSWLRSPQCGQVPLSTSSEIFVVGNWIHFMGWCSVVDTVTNLRVKWPRNLSIPKRGKALFLSSPSPYRL